MFATSVFFFFSVGIFVDYSFFHWVFRKGNSDFENKSTFIYFVCVCVCVCFHIIPYVNCFGRTVLLSVYRILYLG